MKYDFNVTLKNLSGKYITQQQDGSVLTAWDAIVQALSVAEQGASVDKKFKSYRIALKVYEASEKNELVELTIEETKQIKDAVAAGWPPVVMGRIFDLIENTAPESKS
jgi:hypothetical protein